jgi:transposase-like protein
MTKFTEKDMRAAIQAVAEGSSVNKVAAAYGVTRLTL